MSLKSVPKKIGNNSKADANAVFHALDIASGGSLSLIKESIIKSYQGFLDAKFNNLVLDMADNNVSADELIDFINSKSHKDREFMSNLIIKNLHADNRITIFILAKLWANKIKNGSLNYYESSLFTNINTFTHEDFKIYYNEILPNPNIKIDKEGEHTYMPESHNAYHMIILDKLQSHGILLKSGNLHAAGADTPISCYVESVFTKIFNTYLKEFFDQTKN